MTSCDGAGSALKLLYFLQGEQRNTTVVPLMVTGYCSNAAGAYKKGPKLLSKLAPLCLSSFTEMHQADSEALHFQSGTDNRATHGISAIYLQNIVQV